MSSKWLCAVDQTIRLSDEETENLERVFQVEFVDVRSPDKERFGRFDLLLLHSKLSDEVMDQFTRCRYMGIRAHNTDYVNGSLAQRKGIVVRGLPQFGEHAVAEHAFSLIFALTKQTVRSHRNMVAGAWREGLAPGLELRGKHLGVIGYGTIGQEVAAIGRAFGMNVRIASRSSDPHLSSLEEVLRHSDIMTLHASTRGNNGAILTKAEIDKMKDGAILINTARGSLIDYDALYDALLSGKLAGAGLDVYPEEPYRNSELLHLPNVVCTPHIAFHTQEVIGQMNQCLLEQAVHYYETNSIPEAPR